MVALVQRVSRFEGAVLDLYWIAPYSVGRCWFMCNNCCVGNGLYVWLDIRWISSPNKRLMTPVLMPS